MRWPLRAKNAALIAARAGKPCARVRESMLLEIRKRSRGKVFVSTSYAAAFPRHLQRGIILFFKLAHFLNEKRGVIDAINKRIAFEPAFHSLVFHVNQHGGGERATNAQWQFIAGQFLKDGAQR